MLKGEVPETEYETFNILKLVHEIYEKNFPQAIRNDIPITIEIEISPMATFSTSIKAFDIIFSNLLKNAIEASAQHLENFKNEEKIIISIWYDSKNNSLSIKNKVFHKESLMNKDKWNDVNYTSKSGHQGIGLFIINTLSAKTNIKIKRYIENEYVQFELSCI